METFCRIQVKEGIVFQLVCPDTKWNAAIPPYLLKRILEAEDFERWDRLVLARALNSMTDVVYCPKCGTGCLKDQENNAQCPKCFSIFCSFCMLSPHAGKKCLPRHQRLRRMQTSRRITTAEMIQEVMSIKEVYNDALLCPRCRMAISKTEGCNKVQCGNCGQLFCFRCGKAIRGYDHFRNCQLFEMKDLAEWEREMQELGVVQQMRHQLRSVGATVRCPKCCQPNFRDDDNRIFCWACRAHYCALCRKKIDNKGHHLGTSECV